jgi:phosphoenolpyruvate synthase/pyruvate phosphate dikinase
VTGDVVDLSDLDRAQVARAGGKAANLGELLRIPGLRVPAGFCVTTSAFERVLPAIEERLAEAGPDAIGTVPLPDDLVAEITAALRDGLYAVRSSATAEDSASASFAGQHDTYLNVPADAVIDHVRRCWASLFTERAVAYRLRNGIAGDAVRMAVVVQRMVDPRAAGVLFTADPVTGNRKVSSIDAAPGLGEDLVSGLVDPDVYQVRDDVIAVQRRAGDRVLSDDEIRRLAALGRSIEAHFGRPQDIEWCLDGGGFAIVQSRPITTLFPIPVAGDDQNRVYVSVGHQQMMTEAMRPLGLSVWKLTSPAHMVDAGGRLFVDVTARLNAGLVAMMGQSDPLLGDAMQSILDRPGFIPEVPETVTSRPGGAAPEQIPTDPAIVTELIGNMEASLAELKREIHGKTGPELLDFTIADIEGMRTVVFEPRNIQAIMAGMGATWWLNDHLKEWLGEINAADVLTRSAPGNITSESGLALLDVADVIRPHPGVVAHLQAGGALSGLAGIDGGTVALDALNGYLDVYGMRCVGEIDITRPRWREDPSALVPLILSNVRNAAPGERERRFGRGREEASRKAASILAALRELPGGEEKAAETAAMIERVRTFIGYREYPKYHMVSRYFVYKQALLAEAGRLVRAGVIDDATDVFYLTLPEFAGAVRAQAVDHALIAERRAAFVSYLPLNAPRVLTSEGEAVTGTYRRDDLPAGALAGLPVSAGTVEGRARVVLDVAGADLEPGDILVTRFTDPSWTPAFVTIGGLVTEVGGQMTHGAVIAREYGLPAVVGVENATGLIPDGARIRVDGANGWVLLDPATAPRATLPQETEARATAAPAPAPAPAT